MINIKKLTEKDIGRRVRCNLYKGVKDFGKIKTWDNTFIYIVYDGWYDNEREPAYPKYLTFIEE